MTTKAIAMDLLQSAMAAESIPEDQAAEMVLDVQRMMKEADENAKHIFPSVIREVFRKAGIRWAFDFTVEDITKVPPELLMVQWGPVWKALDAWAFGQGEEIPGIKFHQTFEKVNEND